MMLLDQESDFISHCVQFGLTHLVVHVSQAQSPVQGEEVVLVTLNLGTEIQVHVS